MSRGNSNRGINDRQERISRTEVCTPKSSQGHRVLGTIISQETLADWLRHGAQVVLQEGAHQVSGRSGDLAQVASGVAGAIR